MPSAKNTHALAIAALWVAILIAYSNSFSAGLIVDNEVLLLQDPRIQSVTSENLQLIWNSDYWYTRKGNALYRPVTTLSYLFNYAILDNRNRPAGYHWLNYLLHAINASLLYLLALTVFQRKIFPSITLAMIWAVHPVLTESVTNVVGRADLLAAFGILAGLLCYRRAVGVSSPLKWVWLSAAAIAAAIGIFSKESGVLAPLIAVIYDLAIAPATPRRDRLAGYAALTLPLLAYFLIRPELAPLQVPFTDNPLIGAGFLTARLTAIKVIGRYIWLLLVPLRLSNDYSYNAVPLFRGEFRSWEDWQIPLALAACAAIGALALYGWRRDRRWFFFIGMAALGIAPVANLAKLIGTIMAERFLYVPAMGFAGCVTLAILAMGNRFPAAAGRVTTIVVAVLALALAARTYARNADWQDNFTMSASQLQVVPNSIKARAFVYGNLDESVRNVDVALAILEPLPDEQNTPAAYINAGRWYRQKGQALSKTAPSESPAWYRRSLDALLRGERIQRATRQNFFQVYEQLGLTYTQLGDFPNALNALNTARNQNFSADLTREIAIAYAESGNVRQAEITLWEGLIVYPDDRRFASSLVAFYQRSDPSSCALKPEAAGVSLNLTCTLVREHACAATTDVSRLFAGNGNAQAAARYRELGIREFGCQAEAPR